MHRRHAGWIALACTFGLLTGVLHAQQGERCTATNIEFDPGLNGVTYWYNNAWRYSGTSTLKFDCTSGYQSGCGVCTATYLRQTPNGTDPNPTYNPFFWYTCGTAVSLNLTTTAGPLVTGKSYAVDLVVWSLSPTQAQCPPPGNPDPDATTTDFIDEVQPPPQ